MYLFIFKVRPLNTDGSLNLLGLETIRLIYFKNKMAGKIHMLLQNTHELKVKRAICSVDNPTLHKGNSN